MPRKQNKFTVRHLGVKEPGLSVPKFLVYFALLKCFWIFEFTKKCDFCFELF